MKHYAYLDETGTINAPGDAYVLGIVLVAAHQRDALEDRFGRLERQVFADELQRVAFDPQLKWNGLSVPRKTAFLGSLPTMTDLARFYRSVWIRDDRHRHVLDAESLVRAAGHADVTQLTVIIDALEEAHRDRVTRILRQNRLRYEVKCGLSDTAVPLLRLADAVAGASRDRWRSAPYTTDLAAVYNHIALV